MTASAVLDGGPAAESERAFPALDGARIIAATAVLVSHVGFWTGTSSSDNGIGSSVLAHLDVGVAVFFVLSGFLLFRPFPLAATRGHAAPDARAYLWRRALRILPPYWLAVFAAILFLPANADADAGTLLRHLALVQIYDDEGSAVGLDQTWSLCTEVAFYAVLPLLAALLVRLSRNRARRPWPAMLALGGLAVAGPLYIYAVRTWPWDFYPTQLWLPGYAGWFAGGMALALLTVADPDWRPVRAARALGSHLSLCWAGAAALFALVCTPVSGPFTLIQPTPGEAVVRNVLYMGIATLFVLPLVLGTERGGVVRWALSGSIAHYLGEISYGVFLVHLILLAGLYSWLDIPELSGGLIAVTVLIWCSSVTVAAALHVFVERPLRRLRPLVPDRSRMTASSTEPGHAGTRTSVTDDPAVEPTR